MANNHGASVRKFARERINTIKVQMDDPSNRKKLYGTVEAILEGLKDTYGLHEHVITIVKPITDRRRKNFGKGERWQVKNPAYVAPEDRPEGWEIAGGAIRVICDWERNNRTRYRGILNGHAGGIAAEKVHRKVRLGLKMTAEEKAVDARRLADRRDRIEEVWAPYGGWQMSAKSRRARDSKIDRRGAIEASR
jgi:hypothetical protein